MNPRQCAQAPSRNPIMLLILLAAVFVVGVVSLLTNGGQADVGLFTVTFLFLMGISQAGIVFLCYHPTNSSAVV